jgi:hypothetical protein
MGDSVAQTDAKICARDALELFEYSVEALLLLASEETTVERALQYYEQAAFISEKNFKVCTRKMFLVLAFFHLIYLARMENAYRSQRFR